jgi:hypothetical protein
VEKVNEGLGVSINEFTVKGIHENGEHGHHWFIGCDDNIDEDECLKLLDKSLMELNDDYATERKHALKHLRLSILPSSVFIEFMENQGRLGSQSKFPRVLSDERFNNWISFIEVNSGAN